MRDPGLEISLLTSSLIPHVAAAVGDWYKWAPNQSSPWGPSIHQKRTLLQREVDLAKQIGFAQ